MREAGHPALLAADDGERQRPVLGDDGEGLQQRAGLELTGCGMGGKNRSQEAVAGFIASLYEIDGVTRVGMKEATVTKADSGDGGESGGGLGVCSGGEQISQFQIVASFDEAPNPAESAAAPPVTPPPAGQPADGSVNASNPAAADTTAQASVAEKRKKAKKAVDTYVPGG